MQLDARQLMGLLGAKLESDGLQAFLRGMPPAVVTTIEGETYLGFKPCGLSLLFDEHMSLQAVFFYPEGRDGYAAFAGDLPGQLDFAFDRARVRALLGVPERSGGADPIPFLGDAPQFDRYRIAGAVIHLEYSRGEGRIALVTIMREDVAPG